MAVSLRAICSYLSDTVALYLSVVTVGHTGHAQFTVAIAVD